MAKKRPISWRNQAPLVKFHGCLTARDRERTLWTAAQLYRSPLSLRELKVAHNGWR